jgi:hypothetical protein
MTAWRGDRGDRLPDFVVIGAQKGGTTSLWHYLRVHPDVFLPDLKEPNFFIQEGNWSRGIEWYRSLFEGPTAQQLLGEVSPGYTMFPTFAGAAARMAKYIPDARLIYLIREPVDRMISNWGQSRADFLEIRSIRKSFISDLRYVSLSQYATQIEQYLEYFDREALLVIRTEDLATDTESTMRGVCRHLGISPAALLPSYEKHNTSEFRIFPRRRTVMARDALVQMRQKRMAEWLKCSSPRPFTYRPMLDSESKIDTELRLRMSEYLRVEMLRLREIVGPDMDLWGYA